MEGIQNYPKVEIDFSPKIPPLKRIEDKTKIDIRYSLISPFAYAHIYWDEKKFEVIYDIEEPILNQTEINQKEELITAMREMINFEEVVSKKEDVLIDYLDKMFKVLAVELGIELNYESYRKIFYYIARDFIGFNEVDPLLKDYFVEDIECNGVDSPVYIVHRVYRNLKTNLIYKDMDALESFTEKLAQRSGKYISYSNPILDSSLPDGSRVNATYTKDITSKGPTFTIRKFTKTPWTPPQLLNFKTLSPEMMAYLWMMVQYGMNILIAGGTASGKTTLLNAIAFFIPPEERVVSIEDSVTGDSKIIIKENGKIKNITIKEFVENKINAEVMTMNNEGKILWVKPSNYIKHKIKKDIYEVITSSGRKVNVTKDHSLFSLGEDNKFREVKPTELIEKKSFIAVPRTIPIECNEIKEINLMNYLEVFNEDFLVGKPISKIFEKYNLNDFNIKKERYRWWKKNNLIRINDFRKLKIDFSYEELEKLKIKSKNKSSIPVLFKINKKFLEFCGLWLGDGSYDNYNKNSVIISNCDEECRDVFRKVCDYSNLNHSIMNDGEVSMRMHSTIFYKFMKKVIGLDGYSNSKKVPDLILNLSNEQIKHFIRGYFSADGGVKKNEISCASQSYELLEGIQTLFLRLGVISRINDFNRKDKCINMSLSGFDNIEKFKEIGFLQKRKNDKLYIMNKKAHHASSDVIPLSISSLKDVHNNHSKLSWPYLNGKQNIGRNYLQKIAIPGSEYNDLSHSDILWDRVKSIKKINSEEIEVFDLSIPNYEKFICNNILVHNTRELNLPRENWLPSVVRTATGVGGAGEVDLFTLLRASFRQNPDYVIVGEVRGKEAYVLFQGMASGHPSIGTIHADSVDTVIKRLESPPIELSPTLLNILDCVCVMSHAIVKGNETRKLKEIVEIIDINDRGIALTNKPFMWSPMEDEFYYKEKNKLFEKISSRKGIRIEELNIELKIRTELLKRLQAKNVVKFSEVQDVVSEYYKNPKKVLDRFGLQ